MSLGSPDCTPKCRSVRHAEEVIAALTSGSEGRLRGFLSVHCHNASSLRDEFGRTALHLVASLGKRDLLQWLLDSKHADMLAKDKESGWTALHRSAFYGQIHCLMGLIKRGGALSIQDKEGLSALDLTMKDRPAHVVFRNTDPTEVYTWGSNTNFSLGHGNQESRHHPEIVDLFSRSRTYVKQVVLCKFHSVFLSQKGQVYTCGHGQGGRLGHGDEQTYLVPRMVEGLLSHHCSQIAAARDHTVVLTEEGYVYTFGLNTHHQLGLAPPPASSQVPKQVTSKSLKGRSVIGVAAGRFHTVLWTRDAVYTVGLNGGQLGYLLEPNGEKCVAVPRQVSALHHKDVTIAMVAASNGATVCVTEKGDVYLLADYQCKKLASKQLNLKKVLVSGGSLDHRINPQLLHDGGGEKLVILALDEAGRVFCWRSMGSSVRQCRWAYGRQVFMSDIALSKNGMMFVTQEGEGFSGQWLGQHKKAVDKKDGIEVSGHPDGGGVYERIRLEKLPYVHRAVSITMDSKGRNFGVLQADPKTSLYEVPTTSASTFSQHFLRLLTEADETDSIHDVTLQAGDRTFAAHKYILSTRSDFFRKVLLLEEGKEGVEDGEVKKGEDAVGCDLLVLEKVPPEMLEQVLHFIYTDSCEMLVHGTRPIIPRSTHSSDPEPQQQLIHSLQTLGLEKRSALDVYRSLPAKTAEDADKPKAKNTKSGKKGKNGNVGESGQNPVKMLQGVAKKLGLGSLSARLDGVKFENGKISVVQKKTGNKLRFNQKKCSYLCDVTLRSEDGKEFPCHKCVLCARLEYFNSMLGSPWIEASSCTALDMATTSEVLQAILEYIYTDECPTVRESVNVELVCNVLVVADQLLITRLKEICEVAITENLTLKNAAELLEFSTVYNADQLKVSCLQFIVLNMAALLESRALEVLSDDVLLDLTAAYRRMIPAMQRRLITPYADAPDLSAFEDREWDPAVDCKSGSEADHSSESLLKKAKMRAKRKPRRRSDSSGGYNLSDVIQSPPPAGVASSVESLPEIITSDSEGSYMGAGSPRDLQSPVFQDRPDTQEERRVLTGLKTPPDTPVPIPPLKASPAPVLDLRAIMEMEASSLNRGATHRSPSASSSSSSKVPVVPSKMSQKQRKMMMMMSLASREGSTESMSAKSPLKPVKTWSTAVQSPPSSCSFRDLLVEEERRGKPSPVSPETARSPATCAKRVSFKCAESSDPEKPAGPWVLRAVGSPPSTSTFASIVEEERQQEAALIRSREKPLALIQIEERAIQDLLLHYKAINNPEELILVERSTQGPVAIPTWNKH
ncbi:inhibitor of Bruton tyrosine kinase isoform X2 [Carassius auratus]|uniref:Inhibitor of Bruton tyrosine kinase isoform X1 n=1 Tax=Carassius auratus TaxID=7957 RepID=A0A6P6R680_CARAU|nr:inhibitor of Bruton tyrosine kinase isoform X1 [Carassius auratus]XP_026140555.1 inhibitor of Bruton tyrosine kinase isoform X2 [Carassius auratus]